MKPATLVLAAALLAGSLTSAMADDRPGPDWIPMDKVYRSLTDAGYAPVASIEADSMRWEAKAYKDGVAQKLRIDPRTGEISEKPWKR
ncbi:PepSY domain-containing protein [Bosea beijingensis]|uniref:PepSY domain-containing protein n=1 Tax=Bosea beijingensis TaxID=3068632 RepID=UPI0027425683|nr:PepSY domain-containing protein [Bosea sp. REN20]